MIREVDINDISDGNLYNSSDMVKISCNDCNGCSQCCHDMGESIILDPYDIYMLQKGIHKTAEELLAEEVLELHVVDGVILPNIAMRSETNACSFLSDSGRCTIHPFRSGFCRLFPLGRVYEGDDFAYFHQIHECPYPNKAKVKIKKWLDIPNLSAYEEFVRKWHAHLKRMQQELSDASDSYAKNANMFLLKQFYLKPYDVESDFYPQFYERLSFYSHL